MTCIMRCGGLQLGLWLKTRFAQRPHRTEVRPKVHVSDMLPTYLRHTLGLIVGPRPDLHKEPIHGSRPHSRLKARNRGETQSSRVRHTSDIPPTYPGPHSGLKTRFAHRPHRTEVRPKVHVSDILPTYLRHTLGPILGSRPDLLKGSIHGSRPHSRLKARNRGETQSLRV